MRWGRGRGTGVVHDQHGGDVVHECSEERDAFDHVGARAPAAVADDGGAEGGAEEVLRRAAGVYAGY